MAIELPAGITKYFEADSKHDASAVAECFTADAIVRDEGHTYAGRDAIRAWTVDYMAKFDSVAEPFCIADEGGRTVVTSHVSGNFPGSPVDLRYQFVLTDDAISGLEITL